MVVRKQKTVEKKTVLLKTENCFWFVENRTLFSMKFRNILGCYLETGYCFHWKTENCFENSDRQKNEVRHNNYDTK
jgi:hypothetical protein